MFILCIFLPPVAVLFCGKPFKSLLCILLCLIGWIPGVIYAFATVNNHKQEKRHNELKEMYSGRY